MVGGPRIGIDFGTSHTVAMCQWRAGSVYPLLFDASPLLPSAVLATDSRLLVGRDAERGARADPAAFEPYPKRRVDDGTILLGSTEHSVAEVIAAVLRRCLDEAARVAGGYPEQVVLTHPAHWGTRRKAVLGEAAVRAGVGRVTMVPEPTAAAVYFSQVIGQQVGQDAAVVVYDFGGGTFDVAVVIRRATGWEVVASEGLDDVGGLDLDGVLIEGLRANVSGAVTDGWSRLTNPRTAADRRHRRMLWDDAREAKEQLSRNPIADVHVPIYDTDVHITREEFERQARPWLERTVALTATTLWRSGVTRERLAGLFLVGGSSRIPLVATMLHQRLNVAPTVIEQPELVVAQGSLYAVVDNMPAATWTEPAPAGTTGPAVGTAAVKPTSPAPTPTPAPAATSAPAPDAAPPEPAPPPAPPPGPPKPAGSPRARRRRTPVVVAGALALAVAAAVVIVVLLNRTPPLEPLSAKGQANAAAFTSEPLRSFAHRWLNDAASCTSESPNAWASELVRCSGDGWAVNFRAYTGENVRDQAREDRRTAYNLQDETDLSGRGPESGVRIKYLQDNDKYKVIYWDDDGSAVSGDLYSEQMSLDDLAAVWTQYVT
jgi:actin-like ATPase involved in cell morphogenesis